MRVDFNIKDADIPAFAKASAGRHGYETRLPAGRQGLTRIPFRIQAVLPTIRFLTSRGARVVILSHRGRPKKVSSIKKQVLSFTLKPFVKILSSLLKKPVQFADFNDINKNEIKKSVTNSIFLLENLRFSPGEEKNDKKLAKKLASLGDFYVNDAFGVSHRKDASIVAITKYLPSYAGLLLENEIKNLSRAVKNPKKPLVIILGGVKISDKIGVIKNFLKKTDKFLIGGAVANTFFAAKQIMIGDSIYEKDMIPLAKQLLRSGKIILPIDWLTEKGKILDIGTETSRLYAEIIKNAKTIIWNGPMGYFEEPRFAKGSEAVAKAVLKSRAFTIIGGGETTAVFQSLNTKYIFVSTGGGAMLDYLAGGKLPGIAALNKK